MRKMPLILLLAAVLVLILPSALAEGGNSDDSAVPGPEDKLTTAGKDMRNKDLGVEAKAKANVPAERREIAADKKEIINKEAFSKLREDAKAKFEKLRPEMLEQVSSLKAENVEKLKDLKQDRLRAISSGEPERLKKFAELNREGLEKISKLGRARMNELANLTPKEIEARLNKTRLVEADESFRFRPLTLEQTKRSEKAYEQLKENEEKLKEMYEERLQKANETMERVVECRKNPSDEACSNIAEKAINASKDAALKAAERITTYLEKLKERVNGSQDLTEEEAASRIAKIDAIISKVESISAEIAAATTKEELNAAVKRLKEALKAIKSEGEYDIHRITLARANGIIKRMEVIEKKADCSLSSLEETGTDTGSIDARLDEYASLIAKAKEKIGEAKDAFNPDDKAAIEKSRALAKEARDSVQAAQEKLNEIRKGIRDLGGEICTQKQEIEIEDGE